MIKLIPLTLMVGLLLALSGCSPKVEPCPKQVYPDIQAVDTVPYQEFLWDAEGNLDFNSTQRLGKQNKHFRINERYYIDTIISYREDFILKKKGK